VADVHSREDRALAKRLEGEEQERRIQEDEDIRRERERESKLGIPSLFITLPISTIISCPSLSFRFPAFFLSSFF
jgi:hypothetical protein